MIRLFWARESQSCIFDCGRPITSNHLRVGEDKIGWLADQRTVSVFRIASKITLFNSPGHRGPTLNSESMRLAIAAALLANTLPAYSQGSNRIEGHEDRRKLAEYLSRAIAQNRFESSSVGGQRNKNSGLGKKTFLQGGRLKNSPSKLKPTLVECDPDVGVLSCGHGTYCEASPDALMGGFCLPTFDQSQRGLQEIPSANGNSTGPTVYCDPNSGSYLTGVNGTLDCDCSDWNADNSNGTLSCQVYTNYCYEGCNNTCYAVDFTYTTSDEATSFTYCYNFTQPYEQEFCFGSVDAQNCLISVDGIECSSCLANNRLNCESGTCETQSCFDFNCENVGLGVGNTCDQPIYPPVFYECYNSLPGDYDQCLICPDDNIAYPDSLVGIPGYGDYNCSYIAEFGYYGYFNPTVCSETTVLASTVCCTQEPFVCNVCREEGISITNRKCTGTSSS